MRAFIVVAPLVAAGAFLAAAAPAHAEWEATNAPGTCQGALPAFAGTLRARPMALQNEGSTTAFATCSLDGGDSPNAKQITSLTISLNNAAAVAHSVTCTLVDGWSNSADYLPSTIAIPAGGTDYRILLSATSLPDSPTVFSQPNLSCSLPPGTGIGWIGHAYTMP